MNHIGTKAIAVRTPIIKKGSNLEDIVIESIIKASKQDGFYINDKDIIAITEAVVSISQGNYATTSQIAADLKSKFKSDHIGVVFPILSRNRFSVILKAIAKAFKNVTVLFSYPSDEVGNGILNKETLNELGINVNKDVITPLLYEKKFSEYRHPFTGVNMIAYYQELVSKEGANFNYILSNNPIDITKYTNDILVCDIHTRFETEKKLIGGENTVYRLDQILTESVNKSGCNQKFGLLGSNTAGDDLVKLFPNDASNLILNIQNRIKQLTGKTVEVMVYGDGAFKDPVGGIWELADPVVSPFYTKGLEGSPNELKLKLLVDKNFDNLSGEQLNQAVIDAIKQKDKDLKGSNSSLGTTPRRYTDLIGSLCDLMSGSGDKGTPVIYIQNYFKNYTD